MRIGVIGVGVIAVAVVRALEEKYGDSARFFLSPRNAEKAKTLANEFGSISVLSSNQEVVDNSDIVLLAVLPDIAREVVSALRFSSRQHVVSLISEPRVDELAAWIDACASITRVIPLTFIERRIGPVLVFPGTPIVRDLLDGLGEIVVAETETSFIHIHALSAVMGPFYYLADELIRWMDGFGEARGVTTAYLFSLFRALADQGLRTEPNALSGLWREMTPGGLNEDAIRNIRSGGGFSLWVEALEKVRQRIQ